MKKSRIILFPLTICLFLSLAACHPSFEKLATFTASPLTPTAIIWTASPSITVTSIATFTPLPTQTSIFTPTLAPTSIKTPIPTQTRDPNRFYSTDSTFSLVPPAGWQPVDIGMVYPSLVGPKIGNFSLNLVFMMDNSPLPLDFYTATAQDSLNETLKNVVQISEDFLTTSDGKDEFRWVIEDTRQGVVYHQAFYFYESGNWKLTITYTRTSNQGMEYDALVDAAMQTVWFYR